MLASIPIFPMHLGDPSRSAVNLCSNHALATLGTHGGHRLVFGKGRFIACNCRGVEGRRDGMRTNPRRDSGCLFRGSGGALVVDLVVQALWR
jgi:hypothetical protein